MKKYLHTSGGNLKGADGDCTIVNTMGQSVVVEIWPVIKKIMSAGAVLPSGEVANEESIDAGKMTPNPSHSTANNSHNHGIPDDWECRE